MNILKQIDENNKIVIYGAGVVAKALLRTISMHPEMLSKVVGCAVTSINLNETEIDGVPVRAAKDIFLTHSDAYVIIAVREEYKPAVIKTLSELGVKNYCYINMKECIEELEEQWITMCADSNIVSLFMEHRKDLTEEEYIIFLSKQLYNGKLDFEVNLVDHCNLNCQCCNHFSPLAQEYYLDCVQYERDLKRIAEITNGRVGTLTLLGGEPLLHPDIIKAMQISRECLPETEISITSNGLLLGKMSDTFWQKCREWDIHLLLTKYPIHFNYDELEARASEEGVSLSYTYASQELKTSWRLPLKEEGDLNAYKNFMKCYHGNKCIVLREGRLYTCPISANVHWFNRYFNKNMPEGAVNSIDIYGDITMEKIQEFLGRPILMCRHCDIFNYEYEIPWKTSKRQLDEWM